MKRRRGRAKPASTDDSYSPSSSTRRRSIRSSSRQEYNGRACMSISEFEDSLKGEVAGMEETLEENILAILDTQGVKDAEDIEDDRLSFLEAVYAVSVAADNANVPSKKIYRAIFMCLQESRSAELAISSYRLLKDLEKAFPRVSVREEDKEPRLALDHQVWSPLGPSVDSEGPSSTLYNGSVTCDYVDIASIVQQMAAEDINWDACQRMFPRVLTFQFLVSLLQTDLEGRLKTFKGDSVLLENSFINHQLKGLNQRRYNEFIKSLVQISALPLVPSPGSENGNLEFLCSDRVRESAQSIISMVVELNESLKSTGFDHERKEAMEVILDVLHYNEHLFAPFLESIQMPLQKSSLVLKYFVRHAPKPIAKRIKGGFQNALLESMLECFSDWPTARSIYKCMKEQTVQLLLAHAFQASLCVQPGDNASPALVARISSLIVTAFENLSQNMREICLQPIAKQAFIIAEALMSEPA